MDEAAVGSENHNASKKWVIAAVGLAIAIALIAPALPGGPAKPKPVEPFWREEHPTVTARNPGPVPAPAQTGSAEQQSSVPGLWPSMFFIGAGALNQPTNE